MNNAVGRTSGYIQNFGDFRCRQEFFSRRRKGCRLIAIRHFNLLPRQQAYSSRIPHDLIDIIQLFTENPAAPPCRLFYPIIFVSNKKRLAAPGHFLRSFRPCICRLPLCGISSVGVLDKNVMAHCPQILYNSRRGLFSFQSTKMNVALACPFIYKHAVAFRFSAKIRKHYIQRINAWQSQYIVV